jgi:hypothetical protein
MIMHDVTMTHKNKKNKQFLKRGYFFWTVTGKSRSTAGGSGSEAGGSGSEAIGSGSVVGGSGFGAAGGSVLRTRWGTTTTNRS